MSHEHDEHCGCGLTASAYRDADGHLVVRTNILDHPDAEPFARALLAHATGRAELAKAKRLDDLVNRDWKYPELDELVQKARRDMLRWGPDLIRELKRLYESGKLFPLTPDREAMLRSLFRDRSNRLVVRVAGILDGRPAPPTAEGYQEPSHTEAAFRMGVRLDPVDPASHYRPPPVSGPDTTAFEELLQDVMKVPLDEQDARALQFVQRRVGDYVRKPAQAFELDTVRTLLDSERLLEDEQVDWLRGKLTDAVVERMSADDLARELRRTADRSLANDMNRIARTELRSAHAYGAYRSLKRKAAEAGIDDPDVYKITSPSACVQCRRIWGRRGSKVYALSEVEAWELGGGNFGRPADQWGPTIGPVHPNCLCGPLLMYTGERSHRLMLEANDEMLADWRREVAERGTARLPDDTIVGGSS